MKYTQNCYQYVQQPGMLKRCAIVAVELIITIIIIITTIIIIIIIIIIQI
jgi:lipopolysaccharide/colanic/teichoic acid biosynthesis glycosyltransferase